MTDPENPAKPPPPPPAENMWAGAEGAENVEQLTTATFDEFIQNNPSVLVMFYAPCKYSHILVRSCIVLFF